MTDPRSFLLIPNHSMAFVGSEVRIESAEIDLLNKMRLHWDQIGVAAFASQATNTSLSGTLSSADAQLYALSKTQHAGQPLHKLLNYLHAFVQLPLLIRQHKFIYIFCPGYCGLMAGLWARLLRKPYGLYVRGTWHQDRTLFQKLWNRVFSAASFMVVTGESFRRELSRYCSQVENEVPLTALRPDQIDVSRLAQRSPAQLLFAGRLNESKGVRDVIRCLALLRQQGITARLRIAGGGTPEEMASLVALIETLELEENVTLLGHVSATQLASEYERCGTFVFPSYYAEGFPRVLYEAMMYGCAIVTCAMPGTRDFLVAEENCLHCQPMNPADLAERLTSLIQNPALASSLGSKARQDVSELYQGFTEASHADQVIKLMRKTDLLQSGASL